MRPRPAPRAARMANSRFLAVARTSSRFATLAQAMSKTKLTATPIISSDDRASPHNGITERFDLVAELRIGKRILASSFIRGQLQFRVRLI